MKNKFIISLSIIIALSIIVLIFSLTTSRSRVKYEQEGQQLILLVENYMRTTGKLPENMHELNWVDDVGMGPFYEKKSDSSYIVYFCLGFDEYYLYDSREQQWQYSPQ